MPLSLALPLGPYLTWLVIVSPYMVRWTPPSWISSWESSLTWGLQRCQRKNLPRILPGRRMPPRRLLLGRTPGGLFLGMGSRKPGRFLVTPFVTLVWRLVLLQSM